MRPFGQRLQVFRHAPQTIPPCCTKSTEMCYPLHMADTVKGAAMEPETTEDPFADLGATEFEWGTL
jgi:hypothetical protein